MKNENNQNRLRCGQEENLQKTVDLTSEARTILQLENVLNVCYLTIGSAQVYDLHVKQIAQSRKRQM